MSKTDVWVFGDGSLIWYKSGIDFIEEKIGELPGWHRDWRRISKARGGAPTCSLQSGGRVKGVFLKLDPRTIRLDLETIREREGRKTERVIKDVKGITGEVHFWTMGDNLSKYNDTKDKNGMELYRALARRANRISKRGKDGKTAVEYALAVHEFDPEDKITKTYVDEIKKLSARAC